MQDQQDQQQAWTDEQIVALQIVALSSLSIMGALFMSAASLHSLTKNRRRRWWRRWRRRWQQRTDDNDSYSDMETVPDGNNGSGSNSRGADGSVGGLRASNGRMVFSLALINLFMSCCFVAGQAAFIWRSDGGYVEGSWVSHVVCLVQAYTTLVAQLMHMCWQLLFGFNFALRICTPYLSTRAARFVLRRAAILEITTPSRGSCPSPWRPFCF